MLKNAFKIYIKTPEGTRCERVEQDTFTIGRSSKSDIKIPLEGLSRQHIRVSLVDGKILISDLKSSNGTVLNKVKLKPETPHPYKPGEKIQIQGVKLIISLELENPDLENLIAEDEEELENSDGLNLDKHLNTEEEVDDGDKTGGNHINPFMQSNEEKEKIQKLIEEQNELLQKIEEEKVTKINEAKLYREEVLAELSAKKDEWEAQAIEKMKKWQEEMSQKKAKVKEELEKYREIEIQNVQEQLEAIRKEAQEEIAQSKKRAAQEQELAKLALEEQLQEAKEKWQAQLAFEKQEEEKKIKKQGQELLEEVHNSALGDREEILTKTKKEIEAYRNKVKEETQQKVNQLYSEAQESINNKKIEFEKNANQRILKVQEEAHAIQSNALEKSKEILAKAHKQAQERYEAQEEESRALEVKIQRQVNLLKSQSQLECEQMIERAKEEAKHLKKVAEDEFKMAQNEARKTLEEAAEMRRKAAEASIKIEEEAQNKADLILFNSFHSSELLRASGDAGFGGNHKDGFSYEKDLNQKKNQIVKKWSGLLEKECNEIKQNTKERVLLEANEEALAIKEKANRQRDELLQDAYRKAGMIVSQGESKLLVVKKNLEDQISSLDENILKLSDKKDVLEEAIQHLWHEQNELENKNHYLKVDNQGLEEKRTIQLGELKNTLNALNEQKRDLESLKSALTLEVDKLKEEKIKVLAEYKSEKTILETKVGELKIVLGPLDKKREQLEIERDELRKEVNNLKNTRDQYEQDSEHLHKDIRQSLGQHGILKDQIADCQFQLETLLKELDEKGTAFSNLEGEYHRLSEEIAQKRLDIQDEIDEARENARLEIEELLTNAHNEAKQEKDEAQKYAHKEVEEANAFSKRTIEEAQNYAKEIRGEADFYHHNLIAQTDKEINEKKSLAQSELSLLQNEIKEIKEDKEKYARLEAQKIIDAAIEEAKMMEEEGRKARESLLSDSKKDAAEIKAEAVERAKDIQLKINQKNKELENMHARMDAYTEERKKEAIADCQKIIEKAQNEVEEIKAQAQEEANHYKETVKAQLEEDKQLHKSSVEEMIKLAKARAAEIEHQAQHHKTEVLEELNKIKSQAEARTQHLVVEFEKKQAQMAKEQEKELAARKVSVLESLKQKEDEEKRRLASERKQHLTDIVSNLNMGLRLSLKEKLAKGPIAQEEIENHLNDLLKPLTGIVKNVLFPPEDGKKAVGVLVGNGKVATSVKMYWLKVALAAGIPMILLTIHFIFPTFYSSMKESLVSSITVEKDASDVYLAKEIEKRRNKPKYNPATTDEWKATYSDNYLYTTGYRDFVFQEDFEKNWTLAANKFCVERLGLDDNFVVSLMGAETNMHTVLQKTFEGINPDFESEGVARMREEEAALINNIKDLFKQPNFYSMYWQHKGEFLKNYRENAKREPAMNQ